MTEHKITNTSGAQIGVIWENEKDFAIEHVSGEYGADLIDDFEDAKQMLLDYHSEWVSWAEKTIARLTRQLNRWR